MNRSEALRRLNLSYRQWELADKQKDVPRMLFWASVWQKYNKLAKD